MNNIELKNDERIDELNIKDYRIIQNVNSFCFGMDAVLLSGFVKINPNENVLDLGTGTGIIPILIEAKTEAKKLIGLEIQEKNVNMARRSVEMNNLQHKIKIIKGDIKEAEKYFSLSKFDVITSNPPYIKSNGGLKNQNTAKAIARHEILCNLEDVIKASSKLLRVRGRFYMVHRPQRLTEILLLLSKYRLEPKRLRIVYPYIDKEPNMILIEAVRYGKSMLKIEKPLIVYEKKGQYTEEIYDIYGLKRG